MWLHTVELLFPTEFNWAENGGWEWEDGSRQGRATEGDVSPSGQARRAGDYAGVTLRDGRVRQHMELIAQGLPGVEGVYQALGLGGDEETYQHR